jgi:hypothetical protein
MDQLPLALRLLIMRYGVERRVETEVESFVQLSLLCTATVRPRPRQEACSILSVEILRAHGSLFSDRRAM